MSKLGDVPASSQYDDERAEVYTSMHRGSTFEPRASDVCMDCGGRRDEHDQYTGMRIVHTEAARASMTFEQRVRTATRIVCLFRFIGRAADE